MLRPPGTPPSERGGAGEIAHRFVGMAEQRLSAGAQFVYRVPFNTGADHSIEHGAHGFQSGQARLSFAEGEFSGCQIKRRGGAESGVPRQLLAAGELVGRLPGAGVQHFDVGGVTQQESCVGGLKQRDCMR